MTVLATNLRDLPEGEYHAQWREWFRLIDSVSVEAADGTRCLNLTGMSECKNCTDWLKVQQSFLAVGIAPHVILALEAAKARIDFVINDSPEPYDPGDVINDDGTPFIPACNLMVGVQVRVAGELCGQDILFGVGVEQWDDPYVFDVLADMLVGAVNDAMQTAQQTALAHYAIGDMIHKFSLAANP